MLKFIQYIKHIIPTAARQSIAKIIEVCCIFYDRIIYLWPDRIRYLLSIFWGVFL